MYIQNFNGHLIIIVLYVDELLIIGSTVAFILVIKNSLHNAFEMSDLGLLKKIWGSKLSQILMG